MKLPQSGFTWLSEAELQDIDWLGVDVEGEVGYTLEVDLEYTPEIHTSTQDLPFGPERATPEPAWLTQFMLEEFKAVYPEKRNIAGMQSFF